MPLSSRGAVAGDYSLFARLFPELRVDDPILTEEQFVARAPCIVVVEDGIVPVAYALFQVYGATAHVVHVVVDPSARGRGVGVALMEAVRTRVRAAGCERWFLNVKQDNLSAIRTYENCGLSTQHESWTMPTAWAQLAQLPGEIGTGRPAVPEVGDDATLAEHLGIDAARIGLLRARDDVTLAALRQAGAWVAFGAFDHRFTGIYPLRVARVALARPLFDVLRARATEDRVTLVIEGNAALRDALLGVGASVKYALYRMGGSLD